MKYFDISKIGKNQKIEIIHKSDLITERESTTGRVVRSFPDKIILDYDPEWINRNLLLEVLPEQVEEINYKVD